MMDYNVPGARTKEINMQVANMISAINDNNPVKNATILILPDHGKSSALRGFFDENKSPAIRLCHTVTIF